MYEYKTLSQTQLGHLFDVSRNSIGKWLKEIGLRTPNGTPSLKAFDEGYCERADTGNGRYYYVWHRKKTIRALEAAGHKPKKAKPAPDDGEAVVGGLKGPFELRPNGSNCAEIVNSDGTVGINSVGRADGHRLIQVMNLAYRYGALG